ncbi:hypothetical protein N9Y42_05510 [Mariniblastus sp.]|nr:hypothetical protein [Mariniblastus sp.]
MKFELWQLLLHVTSFVAFLGILCARMIPLDMRLGFAMLLGGLLLSFGSSTLPRPELRSHVPNDRQLRRWGDIIAFGLPASLLIWIGTTVVLSRPIFALNVPLGMAAGLAFFVVYCLVVYSRDEDRHN